MPTTDTRYGTQVRCEDGVTRRYAVGECPNVRCWNGVEPHPSNCGGLRECPSCADHALYGLQPGQRPVPCPRCKKGGEPEMLDEHGTLASVSGLPGQPGHGQDDWFWFCYRGHVVGSPSDDCRISVKGWRRDS